MALTDSQVIWVDWVIASLKNTTWMQANGIQQVMYGDQEKIGKVPLICVEPSEKGRTYNGAPRKTQVDFECYILIYFGALQDTQTNRRTTDLLAEAVETRLHLDPTCGSLVIDSMVSRLESGVANKGGSMIRAARLTMTARSQVLLPLNPGV